MNELKITFEKANRNHQEIILKWLSQPHMMEFWDNTQDHKDDILNFINDRKQHYFYGTTKYWIGCIENQPYAFILTDEIRRSEKNLPSLLKEYLSKTGHTIALDFGIGNKEFLGKGLAAPTLKAFIKFYQSNVDHKADTYFIDPDEHNPRAIHVYHQAGFKVVGKEEPATKGGFIGQQSFLMVQTLLPQLIFKPLEETDLNLLCQWLNEPHVKEWWNDHLTDEEIKSKYKKRIGDSIVVPFIVFLNDNPIGFIQYYHADKVGDGWWPDEVEGTVGIDQFIGEKDLINRGIGTRMIDEFINHLFLNYNINKIITDVDPKNSRAVRCYEKVGFKLVKEMMTPDGNAYLMAINKKRSIVNDKHKLGLPLEYQQMPEYFDAHNISNETEAKNALIEKLLKDQQVKTVLDMTCGTGSQVFYLAERGYEVIGSDFSPALIDMALKKAKSLGKDITFIEGDMRELRVGQFDAVITIFNAIGHLTKEDFEKTLQSIRANLKDGGVYIFDIFNLQAITDDSINNFAMDLESVLNGVKIRNVQHSEIDRKNGLLTSHDHYTILKDGVEPEIHTNTFSLQIYTANELQKILARNGFETIHQFDMEGNDFMADKSLNILTVARKKA